GGGEAHQLVDDGGARRRDAIGGRRGEPRQRHAGGTHLACLRRPFLGDGRGEPGAGEHELGLAGCRQRLAVEHDHIAGIGLGRQDRDLLIETLHRFGDRARPRLLRSCPAPEAGAGLAGLGAVPAAGVVAAAGGARQPPEAAGAAPPPPPPSRPASGLMPAPPPASAAAALAARPAVSACTPGAVKGPATRNGTARLARPALVMRGVSLRSTVSRPRSMAPAPLTTASPVSRTSGFGCATPPAICRRI